MIKVDFKADDESGNFADIYEESKFNTKQEKF